MSRHHSTWRKPLPASASLFRIVASVVCTLVIGTAATATTGMSRAEATIHAPSARPFTLNWDYASTSPIVPGTLVDGSPKVLQDRSLNSSFVARVTTGGRPVAGVPIRWRASDPTGHITVFSSTTDAHGRARIWYFAGKAPIQRITAISTADGRRISATMQVAQPITPTVGRYVALYLSAPASITATATNQSYAITATPHTAPTRTYYQLITAWQGAQMAEVAFYGGIQQFDCNADNDSMSPLICRSSRGDARGRMAIFSAWNDVDPQGRVRSPRIVNLPESTTCADFTGEGDGLKCTAPLDWQTEGALTWKVDKLPGAVPPSQRIRSSVSLDGGASFQEIATLDLPQQPDFRTVSPFVENWGGDEAATCLDVALRDLTINAFGFFDGQRWHRPASAIAMGSLYAQESSPCQNYSITATPSGLRIRSGGMGNWIDLWPVLDWESQALPLKSGFASAYQSRYQVQRVDISSIKAIDDPRGVLVPHFASRATDQAQ